MLVLWKVVAFSWFNVLEVRSHQPAASISFLLFVISMYEICTLPMYGVDVGSVRFGFHISLVLIIVWDIGNEEKQKYNN